MKLALLKVFLVAAFASAATASPLHHHHPHHLHPPAGFCQQAYRANLELCVEAATKNPCLAHIIDREDPEWAPTRSYGSWGNTSASYGLGQADPGTKTAAFSYTVGRHRAGDPTGPRWATDERVQYAWALNYAIGKYGSTCAAWAHWQANYSY